MLKKTHECHNPYCTETSIKDKYGNYKRYCSDECMKTGRLLKFKETYTDKDTDTILAKRKATVQEKYGVDNVAKTADVKAQLKITTKATAVIRTQKTKVSNLEKYGVESTNSLQSVKDLKKLNYKEKTGFDHQLKDPIIAAKVSVANSKNADERLAKAAITNIEKYGYANPSSNESVKAKRTETMVERFGVENASQNAEVHAKKIKNSYKSKKYILPSGHTVDLQGWENKAVDDLLAIYNEDEINLKTEDIPRLKYIDNNKEHYYFPDIYIPKDNLIIEVKSEWTYNKNIPTHNLKRDACINAGYNFRFMIYEQNNEYRILSSTTCTELQTNL